MLIVFRTITEEVGSVRLTAERIGSEARHKQILGEETGERNTTYI